jgi:triacylglycerol esterase/lipase EstA (alpha/beta hydrolase family)
MARNPVLLVHGIDDTAALFDRMKLHLEREGLSVSAPNLVPNDGAAALDELAQQLGHYISATFSAEQAIDLVAFSMGGLISRYYLQRLGGVERMRNFALWHYRPKPVVCRN